ncbi:glycosyltransferase family 2 protein [Xanthomarina sp. F2636L]|uniref:glycosyltransferase family 2 protein n=1 Tax=Xanthomarina sp. F2636L TaxID=2996018 RepID=UPI00225E5BD6|nr:glycosyltransferase family 2 protein [Xanthomarina sp. F2636L]MCX7549362.1 glycosyltransferase family 2 protein [Xanthomarina sp. F2636L]
MKPVVSVIIPNYNHKSYLKQRLDSVFNQTFQDYEVILLDDASTDGSIELLKSYQNHPKVSHVVLNEANYGSPFKQWQKGIALAKGAFIWIAESDDYCETDFLEILINSMDKNCGLCYAQSIDVDYKGTVISNRINYTNNFIPNIWKDNFTMKGADFIENYLMVKNVIPNASAVVFKKELVDPNYFNQSLLEMKMCGDWFFWLQFLEHTKVRFVNLNLNNFRNHNLTSRNHNNTTKKKERLLEEKIIRSHMFTQMGLDNAVAEKKMMQEWFKLHSIKEIFRISFYKIKCSKFSYFSFLKNYFNSKLQIN